MDLSDKNSIRHLLDDSLPAHCEHIVIQRILVRHGVSRDLANLLLDDMKRCLEYFPPPHQSPNRRRRHGLSPLTTKHL